MAPPTLRRAVLIGINYTGTQHELRGCINDAMAMRDLLVKHYGYTADNILMLTDDQPPPAAGRLMPTKLAWAEPAVDNSYYLSSEFYRSIPENGSIAVDRGLFSQIMSDIMTKLTKSVVEVAKQAAQAAHDQTLALAQEELNQLKVKVDLAMDSMLAGQASSSVRQIMSSPLPHVARSIVHQPTRANIIESWKWLVSASPVSDFNKGNYIPMAAGQTGGFVFHYSGHGAQQRDTNGDEDDGMDETLCPLDFLKAGMITDDLIKAQFLSTIPAGSRLMSVIDACHSETSFDMLWTLQTNDRGFNLCKNIKQTPTLADIVMISGCRDTQTSADASIGGKPTGAMTYALIKVLEQNRFDISCEALLTKIGDLIRNENISDQCPCMSFGLRPDITRPYVL